MSIRFTIAIPAYNEEKTVLEMLRTVSEYTHDRNDIEIVVVNDGSTDRTRAILLESQNLYDVLIDHEKNQGKGAAIISALRNAKGEYFLIQDADLEYSPIDYKRFFELAEKSDAAVIIGSRLSAPSITRVHYFWHKVGNRFITLFFNVVHNTTYTDIYCGYLMFKKEYLPVEELKFKSWGQQAEILSFLSRKELGIFEIPVSYFGRSYSDGKKIRAIDTFFVMFATLVSKIRSRFIQI